MHPPSDGRRSAPSTPVSMPGAADRAYTELLLANQRARESGQPLLTELGITYVNEKLVSPEACRAAQEHDRPEFELQRGGDCLPFWDAETRQLWLKGKLVKEFRQPAPNQTKLLDVFQEQGWAQSHIDDPLSLEWGEREEE